MKELLQIASDVLKVNILHTGSAYVPEVETYKAFLELQGSKVKLLKNLSLALQESADVLIIMMGRHFFWQKPKSHAAVIHEYHSLGTGRLAKVKDLVRRLLSFKPDGRILLNEQVRQRMRFYDDVPFIYRDMGVPDYFYHKPKADTCEKRYDFAYVGRMNKRRRFSRFLRGFLGQVPERSIALIGDATPKIKRRFGQAHTIHFFGRVERREIPRLLAQCRCAINYIPDIYPYNIQTSTKLLEYLAFGLPVITTDYAWIREFEREMGVRFPRIGERCEGLRQLMDDFPPEKVVGDFKQWQWDIVLEKSGFQAFLMDVCRSKRARAIEANSAIG